MDNNVPLTHSNIPDEITQIMIELGHPDPHSWKNALPPEAFNAPTHQEQRFAVNRIWRQILTSLPLEKLGETREARACLVDTLCETVDYLRFFRLYVIPCAIKFQLPQSTPN